MTERRDEIKELTEQARKGDKLARQKLLRVYRQTRRGMLVPAWEKNWQANILTVPKGPRSLPAHGLAEAA